ncbi:hypothetical protein BKA70DRAFT_1276094 [Coprinopsis sp. MPI-PUGE-AT-0042]|nr:hypothetical protein BKA70DRAFT_1276094 [Coprinopsis sp. MPI-PUGE-AT-0042]
MKHGRHSRGLLTYYVHACGIFLGMLQCCPLSVFLLGLSSAIYGWALIIAGATFERLHVAVSFATYRK